ncbi:MAG: hypothetical protein M0D57_21830 [Sphingobacteriales bacterium JAD_PAG50586_3]|nr:MAG: hypothetical protein M0D57_21830 [Sphingobacteriales bacterium JAD_PAG50586_3]
MRTGACGTAISADPSVRTRVSQTFLKGIYTLSAGSDDFFRLSISGGSSWDIQSNNTTINVSRAIPGGSATNVVYEGYDTGGPGAFAGSVTAQAPVAGSLAANTTCGSATLTWTGGNGYYVWESSTDGSNYTTLVGETNTIASPTSAQNVNPGVQTWYRVRSESGGSVVYSNVIIVSPIPSNDNCASATNITTLPFTGAIVSNACATNDGPASTCDGPYKNIWWRYTATACGVITARTCTGNTNYDNEIAVFSGSCSGTEVICNDDNGAGCTSSYAGVTFNAVAGTTYYIAVGSYNSVSSTGNNQLEVTFSSPALLAGSFTNTTQTICSGGDPSEIGLTSNVGASGGVGTLTYTWQYQVNCTGGWTNIIGANSATYDPPAGLTQTRCYRRVVTDACNNTTATTNFGTVTVVPGPTWATNSVTPTAFCVGSTVSLSATVNNGSGSTITWVRATSPGGAGTTVTTGDNPGVGTFYYRPTYTSSANGCSLADGTETTVTISADPIAPTLASATPASGTSICLNVPIAPANVTFNTFGTSGMGGCADEYQYTINGGTNYFPYTPGVTVITPNTLSTNMVRIQSRRVCGGLTCDGSAETYATIAQWSVYPDLPAPTINGLALDTLTACGIVNIIPDVNSYSFSYYTSVPPAVAVGTGPSIAASSGGTYYVTTYNTSTGCNSLGYATAVLISTASFSFSMTTTPVSCFNGSNGTAQATLDTVGTAPYTFTWSGGTGGGGNFGVNRTGLSAGNYTLLVADAAGCQTQANFQILQPSAPVAFAAPSVSASTVGGYNINCNGGTGSITNVNVSGGNGGYSYALDTQR